MKVPNGGLLYDTDASTEIASNRGWTSSLRKTDNGHYFVYYTSRYGSGPDRIKPLSEEQAQQFYQYLPEQVVEFDDAFPDAVIEHA